MFFPPSSRHCPPKHLHLVLSAGTNERIGTDITSMNSVSITMKSDCDLGFNLRLSGPTAHQNHLQPVLAPHPRMIKSEPQCQIHAQLFVWCLSFPGNCNVQPRWKPTGQNGQTMMAFNMSGQVPFSHWAQKTELSGAHFPSQSKPRPSAEPREEWVLSAGQTGEFQNAHTQACLVFSRLCTWLSFCTHG